ncbi:MAG: class II aldolase/adducin family protein [Opitutae bacterium]|nr:class II aldolase/adducin family protein [Opitutae bacterium]
MTDPERNLRRQIIDTCRQLEARGLNQGTSGNVSVRCGADPAAGFFLTPTNLPYDRMEPADIVHVTLDGQCTGRCRPSSELPFHLAIMQQRRDAVAVIHTHSTHATTIACLRKDIPAVHYLVGLFGGSNLRCAEYATFGTPELSASLLRALDGRRAALMANHGLVVIGAGLAQALALTTEAETLATLYWRALCAGQPVVLPDAEMAEVVKKFRDFGYGPVDAASRKP